MTDRLDGIGIQFRFLRLYTSLTSGDAVKPMTPQS